MKPTSELTDLELARQINDSQRMLFNAQLTVAELQGELKRRLALLAPQPDQK